MQDKKTELHHEENKYKHLPLIILAGLAIIALGFAFHWESHDKAELDDHPVDYNNITEAYWGPPTAAIDWCEKNYEFSPYITEFWNTMSSFSLAFMGFFGMWVSQTYGHESRFFVSYLTLAVIGIGSVLFHLTLLYEWQLADELPMLYGTEAWIYVLVHHNHTKPISKWWMIGLVYYGLGATIFFTLATTDYPIIHQIHILIGVFFCLKKIIVINDDLRKAKHVAPIRLFQFYYIFGLVGFGCWILDQVFCAQLSHLPFGIPNPQLHAFWHIFMSLNCYFGPTLVMYSRFLVLKKSPKILYPKLFSVLPIRIPLVVNAEKDN